MSRVLSVIITMMLLLPGIAITQVRFEPPDNQGIGFEDTQINEESVEQMIVVSVPVNDIRQNVQIRSEDSILVFRAEPAEFQIDAGQRIEVRIFFRPRAARQYISTLTVTAGNPFGGRQFVYNYPVSGRGIEEGGDPGIEVDPMEFEIVVDEEDEIIRQRLTISNTGRADLVFSILEPEVDWLEAVPNRGEIEPNQHMLVSVRNTNDLPENGEYQTNLTILSNDPERREVDVAVTLTVDLVPEPVVRVLNLEEGWSMISSNVDFTEDFIDEEGPDMQLILDGIIDQVLLIKDGNGRFCSPDFNFWGIPFWNTADGYLIKLEENTDLELTGQPIPFDREIELSIGWSLISYYPDYELTFGEIFADIVERDLLILAKNGLGQFYSPEWNFGMDIVIHPGEGILVKVREGCTLQYPEE